MTRPILWTFRRCPYAMRARLAIVGAGINLELREILLRDKPDAFLEASPKATVPVVQDGNTTLEESFDIMLWALNQSDPEEWLSMPAFGFDLITEADGPFKTALDRTKYAVRYDDVDISVERHKAGLFLQKLDRMLTGKAFLFGNTPKLADMAILPFVRQFAHTDFDWFESQPWENVTKWLAAFKASDRFAAIMMKYPTWKEGQDPVSFPAQAT